MWQVQSETVQLHLLAALQSLHREAELLGSTQREVLSAMLREHGAAAAPHAHATDASLSHNRRSTHSEEAALAMQLAASGQPSPNIPRHISHNTRRPSELGPAISGLGLCYIFWCAVCAHAANDAVLCDWTAQVQQHGSQDILSCQDSFLMVINLLCVFVLHVLLSFILHPDRCGGTSPLSSTWRPLCMHKLSTAKCAMETLLK